MSAASFFRIQPGTEECPEKARPTQQQRPVETQVKEHYPTLIDNAKLSQMVANFSAGRLKDHVEGWKSLTTGPIILAAIKHYYFPAFSQIYQLKQMQSSPSEREIIYEEITKLLHK